MTADVVQFRPRPAPEPSDAEVARYVEELLIRQFIIGGITARQWRKRCGPRIKLNPMWQRIAAALEAESGGSDRGGLHLVRTTT